jgi:hypothetical protein
MAGGRVKDPVLKVFGNDYPTMCVLDRKTHFLALTNKRDQ